MLGDDTSEHAYCVATNLSIAVIHRRETVVHHPAKSQALPKRFRELVPRSGDGFDLADALHAPARARSRWPPYSDLFSLQQLTHGIAYMIGDEGGSLVVT